MRLQRVNTTERLSTHTHSIWWLHGIALKTWPHSLKCWNINVNIYSCSYLPPLQFTINKITWENNAVKDYMPPAAQPEQEGILSSALLALALSISGPCHGVPCCSDSQGHAGLIWSDQLSWKPLKIRHNSFSLCLNKSRHLANIYWWMYWGWGIVMTFNNSLRGTQIHYRNTNKETIISDSD